MESTISKTEVMKPIFLKAGIPLVLSVAGFIYVGIIAKRSIIAKTSSLETKVSPQEITDHEFEDGASHRSLNSTSLDIKNDEENLITSFCLLDSNENSDSHDKANFEEEILGLRSGIEELQKRERDLESQFLHYHVMKEEEFVLMELRNMFLLETARVEFLDREISSIEVEKQRLEHLVMEYLQLFKQLEYAKQENGLLQRKVKNLLKKTRRQSCILIEKNQKIEAAEAEIGRCRAALETRTNVIKKLEHEVGELHTLVNQMEEEKNEFLVKLTQQKIEAEGIPMENYNQLVNEVEQVRKDQAAETTELIYLRWMNACLRHKLMRSQLQQQQQQQQIEEKKEPLEVELERSGEIGDLGFQHQIDGSILGHSEPCSGAASGSQACSKKKTLLKKLKTWVEGSDNRKSKFDEKEKHESKCLGQFSASEEAEEERLIQARMSCSSV